MADEAVPVVAFLCVGGLLVLTAGCGQSSVEIVTVDDINVLKFVDDPIDDSAGVGITGRLRLIGDCVGVRFGVEEALLVFPAETSVSATQDDVVVGVAGDEFRLGDLIGGGSAYSEPQSLSQLDVDESRLPASCREFRAVVFEPDPA